MSSSDSGDLLLQVRAAIRDVPDFPQPGIVFKDITPLLGDAELFRAAVTAMTAPFVGDGVTHVVAIESRGFVFGAPAALALGAGLVPARKIGKLPYRTQRVDYTLEYGAAALEMHRDAFPPTSRVLIVDDVLATGGTAAAAGELTSLLGAQLVGFSFLVELGALDGRRRLGDARAVSVIRY